MKLWYKSPEVECKEGPPIGIGLLAAMVLGKACAERHLVMGKSPVQSNEIMKTLGA